MARDHVIRIDCEGTAPRWVRHIGRAAGECTVTWHRCDARRMTAATAQAHATQLATTARAHRITLSVEPVPAHQPETTP